MFMIFFSHVALSLSLFRSGRLVVNVVVVVIVQQPMRPRRAATHPHVLRPGAHARRRGVHRDRRAEGRLLPLVPW